MKSIFIGDPAMCKRAFPASVRAQLGAWTQLPDAPVIKEEILAQPNLYRDTELIFSTWDMRFNIWIHARHFNFIQVRSPF